VRGVAMIALVPILRDFDPGQGNRRFERDQPKGCGEPLGQIGQFGGGQFPGSRRIAALDAGDLPEEIPILEAALDACAGMVVNIEIKNSPAEVDHDPDEGAAVGVAQLLARRGSRDVAIVSAFSLASIDAVKRVSPAVRTGLLTVAALDQAWALDLAHEHGHDALHVQHPAVTAELVDRARALAVSVLAWTVDDADEMRRLAAKGVDTIVTNEVERAVAAVGGRGRRPC